MFAREIARLRSDDTAPAQLARSWEDALSIYIDAQVTIYVTWDRTSGQVVAWSTLGPNDGSSEQLGERRTNGQGLVLAVTSLAREWAELTLADQPALPFDT